MCYHAGSCVTSGFSGCCDPNIHFTCHGSDNVCYCDQVCYLFGDCCSDITVIGCFQSKDLKIIINASTLIPVLQMQVALLLLQLQVRNYTQHYGMVTYTLVQGHVLQLDLRIVAMQEIQQVVMVTHHHVSVISYATTLETVAQI